MSDLIFDDSCVLFALNREAQAFYRDFRPQQRFAGAPCRAWFCGPEWLSVLVLETGVGAAAMASALDWLLAQPVLGKVPYRPRVVISAGFSGALREDLQVGDVVLATEIADSAGNRWPTTWPGELPPGEWRPPLHRGRVCCASELIGDPDAKRRVGREHQALAVDMESAIVARRCAERGVPFGCVRVISDDARTALSPALVALLSGGRVSPFRLLAALLAAPGLARELWRLARDTRRAAEQLRHALGELLTLTLPWGQDL